MDDISLDKLLSGDLNKLPKLPKRVVRLFISSTFTDMTLERNSLMERVYPKLKKYCRERHGLDFQVVDMRWGVRDEATDDHQTVNLCSREIENCQRVSLGPNFIALIGDKYGFRPLLNRIKSSEFRSLRRCLIESDINTDFLDTWYKEDLNAVPAEYLLQPISSILKNFTNKNEPELQMIDQRIWQAIQERLHELLLIGSSRLVKQGRMSESEQSLKYSISVTEREVIEGCLDLSETKLHCLVYVRSIVDLRDQLGNYFEELARLNGGQQNHHQLEPTMTNNGDNISSGSNSRRDSQQQQRKASLKIGDDSIQLTTSGPQTAAERKLERQRRLIGKYIDLRSKEGAVWQVDEQAQSALDALKEIKLGAKFSSNSRNLTRFQVHWNQQDGISVKSEEHKKYLDNLTDHFYQNLTRMIRSAVKSEMSKVETRGLIGEVLQHSHYSLQVGGRVHGRSFELGLIRDYILTGSTRPNGQSQLPERERTETIKPMFLYGVSGSGKTSILARVSTLAHDWVKQFSGRRRSSSATNQTNAAFGLVPTVRDQDQLGAGRNKWSRRPCIIMRFCCTTPESSSMVGMLTSVCCQLQYNFYQFGPLNGLMEDKLARGRDKVKSDFSPSGPGPSSLSDVKSRTNSIFNQLPHQKIPEDFVRLVYTFRQLLENCRHSLHKRRTFVIIIDSIERLSAPAECSVEAKFSWLTNLTALPPNVRLIVSCGSSGTTRGELDDYLHLKRHFLRVHHVERETNEPGADQMDLTSSSDDGQSTSESVSLSGSPPPPVPSQSKVVSRFQLLRRLVLPAARIARASRGLISDLDKSTTLLGGDLLNQKPGVRFTVSVAKNSPQDSNKSTTSLGRASSSESVQSDHKSRWSSQQQQTVCSGLLHIRPLGRELALSVLRRYLAEAGRNLTPDQWAIVDRSLNHCSRPIFVKLAFGEIIHWKSYSTRGDTRGMMFGSDWLVDFEPTLISNDGSAPELERLSKRLAQVESNANDELKFKWQALAIEQQWLNFVDYKSGKSISGSNSDQPEPSTGIKGNGELVIRIGTSANASNDSRETRGGSSVSLVTAINTTGGSLAGGAPSASSSICHLSTTIEDAICQLFSRIELKHGYLLIKHSLSYITAARNGICENELEDILSLDDVVLDDVFQYHLPPVRRIPPLLWTRIRNDLPDYLSERDADGIVLTWHHGQFKTVTEQRYLAQERQLTYVHSLMADYFLGKWADRAKPFRCTKQQVQMAAEQLESAIQQSMRRDSSDQNAKRQSSSSGTHHINRSGAMATRLGSGSGAPGGRSGASFSLRNRLRNSDQHDRLQWLQAKAHRRVPQQPLYYETTTSIGQTVQSNKSETSSSAVKFAAYEQTDDWTMPSPTLNRSRRYNLRKLTELPYHLLRSGRFLDLANETLFNYRWLSATLHALGLQSLFVDLNETLHQLELELTTKRRALIEQQNDGIEFGVDSFQADEMVLTGRDNLTEAVLSSLKDQLATLSSTLRLSASVVHCDPQQLAPQLLGRLLGSAGGKFKLMDNELLDNELKGSRPTATNFIHQLLKQCDLDGCSDCALLPIELCLQSADGLQLSSLEGHPFGVLAMCLASDQRHLLAVSSKFLMWNISTGEIARDIEPKLEGALIKRLLLGSSNRFALAHTSNNLVLALEILTQQTSQLDLMEAIADCVAGENGGPNEIVGMKLIDEREAKRFFVWMQSGLVIALKLVELDLNSTSSQQQTSSVSISIQYQLELTETVDEIGRILEVSIEQVDANSDLMLVSSSVQSSGSYEEMLLTTIQIECNSQTGSIDTWKRWQWSPQAKLVVLGPSLRQLVLADQSGDLVLSRRRIKSWSRGKSLLNHQVDKLENLHRDDHEANLLAIELEAAPKAIDLEEQLASSQLANTSDELYGKLAKFESDLDGDCNELQHNKHLAFSEQALEQFHSTRDIGGLARTRRAKFLKFYYSNRITIMLLENELSRESEYQRYCLTLPKDIRNVGLDSNQCQLTSKIVLSNELGPEADGHNLIVVATRKLLFYSLESEQLLKCIEAHSGRITSMLAIQTRADQHDETDHRFALTSSALVTSSMDRTVKIWNLMNLGKASQSIERLASVTGGGRQFDSICLNNQLPLAACLSRGQLSLWDWQESKKLCCFNSMEDLAGQNGGQHQTRKDDGDGGNSGRKISSAIEICKFSKNGRYLALAGVSQKQRFVTVSLMAISGPIVQSVGTKLRGVSQNCASSEVTLKLVASKILPWENCFISKLKFLSQDSRLLLVVVRATRIDKINHGPDSTNSSASATTQVKDSNWANPTSGRNKFVDILSLSVPEARQLYCIECKLFPEHEREISDNSTASRRRESNLAQDRYCLGLANNLLVAVTSDLQYLVLVVAMASSSESQNEGPSTVLNVYTARDGQLAKSIDLGQLKVASSGQRLRSSVSKRPVDDTSRLLIAPTNSTQTNADSKNADGTRRINYNSNQQQFASINVNQFNRLKAVGNRDRQSLVALMDDKRGLSCLIDVGARLLIARLNSWSGAQSADGHFGLSRMFSGGRGVGEGGESSSALTNTADGLKLLEMRSGRPVKYLLTRNQFESLTSYIGGGRQVNSAGLEGGLASEVDSLLSGFTKPNDAYVYLCQPRTKRLLLLRLRDGQLVANYKLASVPNRIKCSPDGLALVVGLDDGSLLALAIADPLWSETLIRLGQYPSRRGRSDEKLGGRVRAV